MYICDSHTHSHISPDCKVPLANMAEAAVAAGVQELHVTDHCDLLDPGGIPVTSFDWPSAKCQYEAVRAALGNRMILHLGLELGSATVAPDVARRILAEGGETLDFVLGSFHNWIGQRGNTEFFFTNFENDPELCRRAVALSLSHSWTLVTECADCYDSLAHIVYPLRYVHRDGQSLSLNEYEEQVRAIFTQIARTDHALEVNTNRGRDLDCWPSLLQWYRECGGRFVTLGSDAHKPEEMSLGIPSAAELLKSAGFDCVTTFVRRQPVEHKL